jgi:hypothetical protein
MGKFFAALALGLIISTSALSQTRQNPTSPGRAPPATSSTTDDDGTNPLTYAGENYSPTGQRPSTQQPSTRPSTQKPSTDGTRPDPSATRESPTINGNGTAGEGT